MSAATLSNRVHSGTSSADTKMRSAAAGSPFLTPTIEGMTQVINEIAAEMLARNTAPSRMISSLGIAQVLLMHTLATTNSDDQLKTVRKMHLLRSKPNDHIQTELQATAAKAATVLMQIIGKLASTGKEAYCLTSNTALVVNNAQISASEYSEEVIRKIFKGEVIISDGDVEKVKKFILACIQDPDTHKRMGEMLAKTLAKDFEGTSAALMHVLFFKALWKEQFDKKLTEAMPFVSADGSTVACQTMIKETGKQIAEGTAGQMLIHRGTVHHGGKEIAYTLIDLPYKIHKEKGGERDDDENDLELRYVAIIPDDPDLNNELAAAMPVILKRDLDKAKTEDVLLHFPKTEFAEDVDILEDLNALGWPIGERHVIDKIVPNQKIIKARQKMVGRTDEDGSVAAVVTSAFSATGNALDARVKPKAFVDLKRPHCAVIVGSIDEANPGSNTGLTTHHVPLLSSVVGDAHFLVQAKDLKATPPVRFTIYQNSNREESFKQPIWSRFQFILNLPSAWKPTKDSDYERYIGPCTDVTIANCDNLNKKLSLNCRNELMMNGTLIMVNVNDYTKPLMIESSVDQPALILQRPNSNLFYIYYPHKKEIHEFTLREHGIHIHNAKIYCNSPQTKLDAEGWLEKRTGGLLGLRGVKYLSTRDLHTIKRKMVIVAASIAVQICFIFAKLSLVMAFPYAALVIGGSLLCARITKMNSYDPKSQENRRIYGAMQLIFAVLTNVLRFI